MTFISHMFKANGMEFHAMVAGPEDAPLMLMLHGFPEYWAAWADVGAAFMQDYRVVLPDQRGFNLSAKPQALDDYATKHLVADMMALADQLSPDRPIILCGHDWGASVAYAMAMRHAERISHLVIANGVHPICFQKALFAGGAQTDASQYMNLLRTPGSEGPLSANNFKKLLGMFEKFSTAPWLDDDIRNQYRAAWSQGDSLPTMLNWYRGSPMVVPTSGTPAQELPITEEMKSKYRLSMPHLVLWGMKDIALLPDARADLNLFCDDLHVVEHEDASHWILHERPDWVANEIKGFLS